MCTQNLILPLPPIVSPPPRAPRVGPHADPPRASPGTGAGALRAALHLVLAGAAVLSARAEFAAAGHGLQPILQGSFPGAALFLESRPVWTNAVVPPKPYVVETAFELPACDAVAAGRLVLTVWGGTAASTARLDAELNGVPIPGVNPLVFGSTNDLNAVFRAGQPSVYGSGSGVWLLGLPVPVEVLRRDGMPNAVRLTIETPDAFDGRVNHVTLLAVYQAARLTGTLDLVVAEGSGDVNRMPTGSQVDTRRVDLGSMDPEGALAARLEVLYTYGDVGQNDRLDFNGVALGGDDVADYDKAVTGLDFGPVLAGFDVLAHLAATNTATVSVAAAEVPGTRETSLRPQLIVLQVARPTVAPPTLDIGLGVVLAWPQTGGRYQLSFRPDAASGDWRPVTNEPVTVDGRHIVILPPGAPRQFYRLLPQP